ncbi:integrase core domain-containing protein [Stenotrophomonas sp. NPDC087984]
MTNAFAMPRLLPMADRNKDAEILALRHQITVLERQLGKEKIRFTPSDRAFLAALLHPLPPHVPRRLRLLVRPDTVLRWHRNLVKRRHAARRQASTQHPSGTPMPGPPSFAPRLMPCWPATSWRQSPCRGYGMYVLVVIEHGSRRIRVLGATAHPTASWVAQAAKNLVMALEDLGFRARFMIRDRDGKFPALFDAVLTDAGIVVVLSGVRMPRMNSIMERWVQTCRRELLDRTLIWNQRHLLYALREFEQFYNAHRPHQGLANARPLHPLPAPITDPDQTSSLDIRRRERLGGILHEYRHAA